MHNIYMQIKSKYIQIIVVLLTVYATCHGTVALCYRMDPATPLIVPIMFCIVCAIPTVYAVVAIARE